MYKYLDYNSMTYVRRACAVQQPVGLAFQAPTMPQAEDKASGKGLRSKRKPCNSLTTNPSLTLDAMTIARPTPLSNHNDDANDDGDDDTNDDDGDNDVDVYEDDHVFDGYYDDDGGADGIRTIWSELCMSEDSEFI